MLLVAAALGWRFGGWGALALLWLPWSAYKARQRAGRAAYACSDELVAVRGGWWTRHWRFAELDKLQALQLTRSPLDRRCGTATLWLDTAGAGALAPPLRIRFLPEAEAQALYARAGAHVGATPAALVSCSRMSMRPLAKRRALAASGSPVAQFAADLQRAEDRAPAACAQRAQLAGSSASVAAITRSDERPSRYGWIASA